jgi:cytochrome c5
MNFLRTAMLAAGLIGALGAIVAATDSPVPTVATANASDAERERWMIEGERRYRTNCSRCHQPPHKFAPRVMATAVRHMRVRGMLTEDDMKYVLYYMTH